MIDGKLPKTEHCVAHGDWIDASIIIMK